MTIICLLACMAWIVGLTWMILCPIERDRQLSRGKARNLLLVIAAITTLPMVFTFLISKINVAPEELVYDEGMYQKWQAYPFQKDMDSTSYTIINGDTAIIYTPKSFKEKQIDDGKYDDPSLLLTVYYQFVDPGRQNMATTSRGRLIAMILSLLGMILMTGLLVSLTSNFFQRRIERWRNGQIRYTHGLGRFCIIVGANEMLSSTIEQLDKRYGSRLQHIIVLTSRNIPELRSNLFSELADGLEKKVVFYAGKLNEKEEIKDLRCYESDEVFVLGDESTDNTLHDTLNIECVKYISHFLSKRKEKLNVHVLLNDTCTYSVFHMSELEESQRKHIEFMPFNTYETWARKVLVLNNDNGVIYEPIDSGNGIKYNDDKYVHLIIAGMTDMGMALAVEAAHIAHYPNYARDNRLKTIITFIDDNIKDKERDFKSRYRGLFEIYETPSHHLVTETEDCDFLDVEWEFMEGDLKNRDFLHQCVELGIHDNTLLTLALCYDDMDKVISTALSLPQSLYEKCIQVLAYQQKSDDIMKVLARSQKQYFSKIRPFGIASQSVNIYHNLMPLAKLVNYVYNHPEDPSLQNTRTIEEGKSCDNVTLLWSAQTTANKWSNVYNCDSLYTKMRSIGHSDFTNDDIKLSEEDFKIIAEVEHRRWNMEKLLMGFRSLTLEEQQKCLAEGNAEKKHLKNQLMAHLDICSLQRLKEVDYDSVKYDEDVTRIIPTLIKELSTDIPDAWKY